MKDLTLSEIQKIQVELLSCFARWCKRNQLRYWVAYGTLLGAVRHKGFIPWDDDTDAMMPREDYEKLKSILPPENTYLIGPGIKNSFWLFYKLCINKTQFDEPSYGKANFPYGMFLDISPLDKNFKTPWLAKAYYSFVKFFIRLRKVAYIDGNVPYQDFWKRIRKKTKAQILSLIPETVYNKIIFYLISLLQNKTEFSYEDFYGARHRYLDKEWYSATDTLIFENVPVTVPVGYTNVLVALYGEDWKTPKNREISHGKSYIADDDTVEDILKRLQK